MTELIFWETTIGKRPVSFALDITPMLVIGIRLDSLADANAIHLWGWHDLTIYLGPLSLTFTVYGSGA
jgi:hypothetical protein